MLLKSLLYDDIFKVNKTYIIIIVIVRRKKVVLCYQMTSSILHLSSESILKLIMNFNEKDMRIIVHCLFYCKVLQV